MKSFREDLINLTNKIKNGEHFAYLRFSDGELRVLQNKRVVIDYNRVCVGDHDNKIGWTITENEHKEFDPEKHGWVRDKLIDTFLHNEENYYKGISCRCCLSGKHGFTPEEEFLWQVEESGLDIDDYRLTWSNLFLNGNYPWFLENTVKEFANHDLIIVCNKNYNDSELPFKEKVKKWFTVGENCMVNDIDLIETIKSYVEENKIQNHLFLLSAGSLSEFIAYEMWQINKNNSYIDIGSTLNPLLGFPLDRRYLRGYWANASDGIEDIQKICIK